MANSINIVLLLVRMIVETTLMKRTAVRLPPGECRNWELDFLSIGISLVKKKLKCQGFQGLFKFRIFELDWAKLSILQ